MSAELLFLSQIRRHTSAWMTDPDDWVWTTPEMNPQGFGRCWRDDVGRANLLWLALNMDTPPSRPYNMRYHKLCMLLVETGSVMSLGGLPLFDQAGALTLAQFRNLCAAPAANDTLIAPLLALLANRRMKHATSA